MDIASTTSLSIASQYRQSSTSQTAVALPLPSPAKEGSTTASTQQVQPSQEATDKAVKQVNAAFLDKQNNLFASIEKDKLTGISVFKITDKTTNEVVRQLPSKAVVLFAQSLAVPQGWRGQLILDKI